MITLHFHLQPQYKYELFHINFTTSPYLTFLFYRMLSYFTLFLFHNLLRIWLFVIRSCLTGPPRLALAIRGPAYVVICNLHVLNKDCCRCCCRLLLLSDASTRVSGEASIVTRAARPALISANFSLPPPSRYPGCQRFSLRSFRCRSYLVTRAKNLWSRARFL